MCLVSQYPPISLTGFLASLFRTWLLSGTPIAVTADMLDISKCPPAVRKNACLTCDKDRVPSGDPLPLWASILRAWAGMGNNPVIALHSRATTGFTLGTRESQTRV